MEVQVHNQPLFELPFELHINIPPPIEMENFNELPRNPPVLDRHNADFLNQQDWPESDSVASEETTEDPVEECIIIEVAPGVCETINVTGMTQDEIDALIDEIQENYDEEEEEQQQEQQEQ